MPSDDLLKYFIEKSNERFDAIEKKIDMLISFRLVLIGASVGVSGLISAIFQIAVNWGGK